MKKFVPFLLLILVSACASPAKDMTAEQVSHLSDEQLCDMSKSYAFEAKIEVEIGKRDLQCTDEYLACKRQGYKPRTPDFENCQNYQSMMGSASKLLGNAVRNSR
ncbi:MAG: hypothetical protein DI626_05805 [Micavibrio aeruginosavorus]|uniref:Lipoprotein n=1 Tax=Micavibrio aeruginosavorus TaxID=349221 RepID=A0A2W5BUB1_9BACT|nr:MAG: hypothetical protein DI626_05805 [Micavibrio aeruginosavorus]